MHINVCLTQRHNNHNTKINIYRDVYVWMNNIIFINYEINVVYNVVLNLYIVCMYDDKQILYCFLFKHVYMGSRLDPLECVFYIFLKMIN